MRRRVALRVPLGVLSGGLLAVAFGGAVLGVGPVRGAGAPVAHQRSASEDALMAGAGVEAPVPPPIPPLPRSTPLQVVIPSLGVDAPLLGLGMGADGTPELPPFAQPHTAGWLRDSATPGERGTAVLLGHVDTTTGPAVFWGLSALRPGAQVQVARLDGRTAVFTVAKVAAYRKQAFPAAEVYGPAADAELRLITCGGPYDTATRSYRGNVVVYAHLTGVR